MDNLYIPALYRNILTIPYILFTLKFQWLQAAFFRGIDPAPQKLTHANQNTH